MNAATSSVGCVAVEVQLGLVTSTPSRVAASGTAIAPRTEPVAHVGALMLTTVTGAVGFDNSAARWAVIQSTPYFAVVAKSVGSPMPALSASAGMPATAA